MKRAAILLIALIAVSAALWAGADKLMSRASRVQATYSKDNGYFYRLIAKFTVKETGEELNFDYVVACNIRVTRWRDGGLSNDSTFSPHVMVKTTSAGHAVMLKTLKECAGLTSENGNLPPDLLPIAIWFDSVDDLSVGLACVSEDAYDIRLRNWRSAARASIARREPSGKRGASRRPMSMSSAVCCQGRGAVTTPATQRSPTNAKDTAG